MVLLSNIIYLTDYDTVLNQNKTEEFNCFKAKFSHYQEVLICETLPSIEFWFLLHFVYTTREFINSYEVEKELKKYIPDYSKEKSYLDSKKWVEKLIEGRNFEMAKSNSKRLLNSKKDSHCSKHLPYSKVHKAIEKFEES